MFSDINIDSTDTEEENFPESQPRRQDVSLSSIKTQDSFEKNPFDLNLNEEAKELDYEIIEFKEPHKPFLSLIEAHQSISLALASTRIKLGIKRLNEIQQNLNKICENFQFLKKQD